MDHVAIMKKSWGLTEKIISGEKKIESRWYKFRHSPWGKIKKGDNLFVRGPYGKGYPTHYFKGNNIIIIGGGCGIAPLKGVIEYIEKNISEFKDIYLFFGFRLPDELLFREQLSRWQNKFKLQVSFDKIPNKTCLEGRAGFITQLIEESNLNNQNKIVIICGPPVMMSKTIQILQNRGFNNDQIFISMERLMNCGIGKCGHCMIHGKYTCLDGPVFRYDQIEEFKND